MTLKHGHGCINVKMNWQGDVRITLKHGHGYTIVESMANYICGFICKEGQHL